MDFEEFLLACSVQKETIDLVKSAYINELPVNDDVHAVITELFCTYIIVGGMPEVVQNYVDTHDIGLVLKKQKEILELYRLDISKYAEGRSRPKIRAIFDSIPSQLNDKNRRFTLASLKSSARMERYEDSFNWLTDAGVALPCFNVSEPTGDLVLNEKRNIFKLFMSDSGLLAADSMDDIQFSILKGDVSVNMGSILENVMAELFVSNGYSLHYYDSRKFGELDFVLQDGSDVDLVEIKSGKDYKNHSALDKIMGVAEWKHRKAMVFCMGNVSREGDILYLPWYMASFMEKKTVPEGSVHVVDLKGL
ncbi:MAG: ATP-binding protein [Bullifex sp.]